LRLRYAVIMIDLQVFEQLGLALAVGLLIGLERGWRERAAAEGSRVAGIRTFALIGLGGGLAALLTGPAIGLAFGLVFAGFGALMIAAYIGDLKPGNVSATTTVAALVTFLLGAISVVGQMEVAAAAAVVTAILLSAKPVLHRWVERIEYPELTAVLKLLLISVVMLPVLPNRTVDHWDALNPYELWWMVVLIAGLSFCGYVAVRLIGPERGVMLTGLLGGLVSSTVATLNLARLSRQSQSAERLLAAAAAVACATMLPRILLVVGVLNPPLLLILIAPLGGAAVVTYLGAGLLWHRPTGDKSNVSVRIDNPFEFWLALRFGLLLTAIMLLARLVPSWVGEQGVFVLAAIAGLGDVDAISLSMSRYGGAAVSLQGAAVAIAIAAFANTLVKAGLAFIVGHRGMAWRLAAVLTASAAVAAAIFLWQGASPSAP
jgi:uncharacterized membrane protein (DUF4010 family)